MEIETFPPRPGCLRLESFANAFIIGDGPFAKPAAVMDAIRNPTKVIDEVDN